MPGSTLHSYALKRMLNTLAEMRRFAFRHFSTKGLRNALVARGWKLCVIRGSNNDPLSSLGTVEIPKCTFASHSPTPKPAPATTICVH